jgi:hypothetical protein
MYSNRRLLRSHRISIASGNQRRDGGGQVSLGVHSLFYAVHRGGLPRADRTRFSSQGAYEDFRREQESALRRFLEKRAQRSRHVIVSDEYLFQLDGETVSRVAAFLASTGHGDVRVIVYLREPSSLFLSLAQQRLKGDCRLADPFSWHYPYLAYLQAWEREFPGRLTVRSQDRSALTGSSVVTDFAAWVAEALALQRDALAGLDCGEDANQTLSADAMDLLWRYQRMFHSRDAGRYTKDGRRLLKVLLAAGERLGLEPPRLRPSIRDLIVSRHRPELMGLIERYGIRFAGVEDHFLAADHDASHGPDPGEMPPVPATSAALGVRDLIDNLNPATSERLWLHCLAELCSQAAR